jgi:dGTPase
MLETIYISGVRHMSDYFEFTDAQNELLRTLTQDEDDRLSPYAAKNGAAVRERVSRHAESPVRTPFGIDIDKILHNPFYNRYTDKTQVFSFYKNDDITRRALHVQLVSRIGRIIGRALKLNLDLIEAIALGHDIGHTPFGHKGEKFLSDLYFENCGRRFHHNVHSIRVLKIISRDNLTLQTLDGILCHCGEKAFLDYRPKEHLTFDEFNEVFESCYTDESVIKRLIPYTLEGCVVRISDMIAYIGKDRQDAFKAGIWTPELRDDRSKMLGTNTKTINNMICNIVKNSLGQPFLKLDEAVFEEFREVKDVNDRVIYANDAVEKPYFEVIKPMMAKLYPALRDDVVMDRRDSYIYRHHMSSRNGFLNEYYLNPQNKIAPDDIVTDFIASMTDDYFVDLFKTLFPDDPLNNEISYVPYFD